MAMSMKKMSPMKGMKKLNEYMTKSIAARKANAPSFVYKGNTYVQKKASSGMIVYKKK